MKNVVFRGKKRFFPFRPILNNINHRIAKKNIGNFPQLAILSFDHIGLLVNLDGRYEHDALDIIKEFILTSDHIDTASYALDIGANVGNHALFFAEYFEHVFAFEPNPIAHQLLEINAVSRNISALNYGVSDKNCKMAFRVNASNIGGSKIVKHKHNSDDSDVINVEVRRLDDLDRVKDAKISMIKIDVEGHELPALQGAKNIIERNAPVILFEQGIDEIKDGSSDVIDFLRSCGYRFSAIENRYDLGESFPLKLASLLLKTVLGYQKILVDRSYFDKKYYEMIVAIKP